MKILYTSYFPRKSCIEVCVWRCYYYERTIAIAKSLRPRK